MNFLGKKNPYAIYVFCDGSMDYDSKNTGGIGYKIEFPESVSIEDIHESFGKYERANIERMELEGIIKGMDAILYLYEQDTIKFASITTIIFVTDRFRLNDNEGTNPYRIRDWRKNGWCNHEGKPVKNSDLLDKLDKKRKKLSEISRAHISIEFRPRKLNRTADKLAKAGKQKVSVNKSIAIEGLKVGVRKYDGSEIPYNMLKENEDLHVHIFLKRPVADQWEISADVCDGIYKGDKIIIYVDSSLESRLHRRHEFIVKIKEVFSHHIKIFTDIKDIDIQ